MSVVCCPLSGGIDDGPEFLNEEIRRAAKPHTCDECDGVIQRGEKYEIAHGKWDGSMNTYKTCLLCREIRNHFACGSGWIYGQLWQDLAETFFQQ